MTTIFFLSPKKGVLGDAAENTLNDPMNRRKLFNVAGTEVEINYNEYFQAKRKLNSLKRQAARGEDVNLAQEESAVENMQRYTVSSDGKELTSTVNVRNKSYVLGNDALGRDLFIRIV